MVFFCWNHKLDDPQWWSYKELLVIIRLNFRSYGHIDSGKILDTKTYESDIQLPPDDFKFALEYENVLASISIALDAFF